MTLYTSIDFVLWLLYIASFIHACSIICNGQHSVKWVYCISHIIEILLIFLPLLTRIWSCPSCQGKQHTSKIHILIQHYLRTCPATFHMHDIVYFRFVVVIVVSSLQRSWGLPGSGTDWRNRCSLISAHCWGRLWTSVASSICTFHNYITCIVCS